MSTPQYQIPPGGMPPTPGMSTAAKVLIWLAVTISVLLALSCGGLFLAAPRIVSWLEDTMEQVVEEMEESVSDDSSTIVKITEEIARISIPEELAPQMSMDMKIPLTDQRCTVWVAYRDEETDSTLFLMALDDSFAGQHPAGEQWQWSMERSFQKRGLQSGEVAIEQSYERQVEIHGETATFTIARGTGMKSKTPRIRVNGTFQGEIGPVVLEMNVDAEKFPAERIVEMLESIE